MPNVSVAMPIIVGDRIFVTAEPCDLVCIDKASGKILWIRSNSEFEGLPADELKANPIYTDKLAGLAAQLEKANDAVAAGGNNGQKRNIEKQIVDAQQGID